MLRELHFPKPCSFLPLFVGPSVLFSQHSPADVCWTILELDAVRLAAFQKTESYGLEKLSGSRSRHALNLELLQSQGASIATPEKASVHRKTAVPFPLGTPTPFRRVADRYEPHRPGALSPCPPPSHPGTPPRT